MEQNCRDLTTESLFYTLEFIRCSSNIDTRVDHGYYIYLRRHFHNERGETTEANSLAEANH